MRVVGEVLTILGASAGIAVLLIMALVPLLVDSYRPHGWVGGVRGVRVTTQRGPSHLSPRVPGRAGRAGAPRA
jgi:hypothetical protein